MNNKSIKEELIDAGFKDEYVNSLKPSNLKSIHASFKNGLILPSTPSISGSDKTEKPKLVFDYKNPPKITDPNWTIYAMSKFEDDELEGQNPRLEGLRRVTELLVGPINEETSEIIQAPSPENGMTAVVKCRIKIYYQFAPDKSIIFDGCADASPNNCDNMYSNYLTAMAETRSKGRAYRSALRLKRVISAEEATFINETNELGEQSIKSGQITMINVMCDRLQVSASKLLKFLEIKKESLKELTTQEAISVLNQLNLLQNQEKIPEILKRV